MNHFPFIENISIGIDLVEVDRFKLIEEKKRFMDNIFTENEIGECEKKINRAESFASRFAAKEAVRKTIKKNLKFNEIEIISQKDGTPEVNFLDGEAKQKYKSIVSISHTGKYAQAVCLTFRNE